MNKMGFSTFTDGYTSTNHVAPKSEYSKEQFEYECTADQFYTYGETKEGFVRWYPRGKGEDNEFEGGCYSFCKEGRGSFAVWYNEITGTLPKATDSTESPSDSGSR